MMVLNVISMISCTENPVPYITCWEVPARTRSAATKGAARAEHTRRRASRRKKTVKKKINRKKQRTGDRKSI
jgi:hypothetical protein